MKISWIILFLYFIVVNIIQTFFMSWQNIEIEIDVSWKIVSFFFGWLKGGILFYLIKRYYD